MNIIQLEDVVNTGAHWTWTGEFGNIVLEWKLLGGYRVLHNGNYVFDIKSDGTGENPMNTLWDALAIKLLDYDIICAPVPLTSLEIPTDKIGPLV